jgi:hypothetical protein
MRYLTALFELSDQHFRNAHSLTGIGSTQTSWIIPYFFRPAISK